MNPLMDELTFRSYAHQRMMFPDVQPERWTAIFQNVPAMEERFLKNFIAKLMEAAEEIEVADGSGLPNSGVTQGNSGEHDVQRDAAIEPFVCSSETLPENGQISSGSRAPATTERLEVGSASLPLSPSLPVPLGREVSGVTEGCDEQMRALQTEQGQVLTANGGMNQFARSCNKSDIPASPADQILEVAPRQEQPTKEVSHVAGDWSPDLMRPENQLNSSLKAKTGVQSSDCASEIPPVVIALDHFTFDVIRFVDERLSIHALEMIAAKLPDLELAEQYHLEEIEAESESRFL